MKSIDAWNLLVIGCGTANLACVRALGSSDAAAGLRWAGLIDPAVIREHNAATCPEYGGHEHRRKVERLAELVTDWFGLPGVALYPWYLEEIDWAGFCASGHGEGLPAGPLVGLIGLDDWGSRLRVVERLRHAAGARPDVLPVQVAVDRDQAQVTVLGNRWDDACPACGIFPLPESEPCMLLSPTGELVRGNLDREARAAGDLVAEIVADYAADPVACRWVGTKTNLNAESCGSRQFVRRTRPRSQVAGCMGPHGPATPVRPEELLGMLAEQDDHDPCAAAALVAEDSEYGRHYDSSPTDPV